jgi:hypothetical protein
MHGFGLRGFERIREAAGAADDDGDIKLQILILGGDGFCGWPTSLHLSARGHDIVIVDNLSRRNIDIELEAARVLVGKGLAFQTLFCHWMIKFSNPGSGTHCGSSFPMRRVPSQPLDSDALGRPFGWSRIFIVDSSVRPSIPGTDVGLRHHGQRGSDRNFGAVAGRAHDSCVSQEGERVRALPLARRSRQLAGPSRRRRRSASQQEAQALKAAQAREAARQPAAGISPAEG